MKVSRVSISTQCLTILGARICQPVYRLDYELYDRGVGVRFPAGARDFTTLHNVQTSSGVHLASCTMGTAGSFPGGKANHSPSSSVEVKDYGATTPLPNTSS
jgi:hypothetical protein